MVDNNVHTRIKCLLTQTIFNHASSPRQSRPFLRSPPRRRSVSFLVVLVVDDKMDSSDALMTPTTSSIVTSSSDASSDPSHKTYYLLEISLISAQDLPQVSKSMRTYAVAWIHPKRKLTSCVDKKGHHNPTWNDKFVFYVNDEFLMSDHAAVKIEIYNTSSWFKDVLVGTVHVLVINLITNLAVNNPRFVALQIRRPSGKFQGKLNMGVSIMDSKLSYFQINPTVDNLNTVKKNGDIFGENQPVLDDEKKHLWRSHSLGHENIEEFPEKRDSSRNYGSTINGSMCNASELCSDIGPSASIVAAEIAQNSALPPQSAGAGRVKWWRAKEVEDIGSSIVEEMTKEEATAKGLTPNVTRFRKEASFPSMYERDKSSSRRVHIRRHSDIGLFSCFANAYGFEFTIACGASNKPHIKDSNRTDQKKKPSRSKPNSA